MLRLENAVTEFEGFRMEADLALRADVTVLLGPSGAGKSTLLNMIAGFVPLSSGQIFWEHTTISDQMPSERPVSMIFQDNNLFPHLNVTANLTLALTHGRPSEAQINRIHSALDKVGLSGYGTRMPGDLSGGQQARVALARVLLQSRPLMLLDEAFSALGPALKREMLLLVKDLCKQNGIQLVMISHDPEDGRLIADEGVVVSDGTVTEPVAIDALLTNPPKALADYLG
ncbi:MAG: ATP-binding cassette domain-containing protein [Pseudomonadota bacterium]